MKNLDDIRVNLIELNENLFLMIDEIESGREVFFGDYDKVFQLDDVLHSLKTASHKLIKFNNKLDKK